MNACELGFLPLRPSGCQRRDAKALPSYQGSAWLSAFFKVRGGEPRGGLPPASLKTEQRPERSRRPVQARSTYLGLPRKEVIQPQLPLRLPCYDFTPITSPTFDGSLPKGLGHRLRVLPAFVV